MAAVFPKAIITGAITDVGLSMLIGIPFSSYVAESRGLSETPQEQMTFALMEAVHASVGLTLAQFAIGFSCSLLGGYVAAAIAKSNGLLNGVLASWLCLGVGIYFVLSGEPGGLLWLHALSIVGTPLCYLGGAYLWLRRNRPLLFAPNTSLERTRER